MLGQSMITIQKSGEGRVCCDGGGAILCVCRPGFYGITISLKMITPPL